MATVKGPAEPLANSNQQKLAHHLFAVGYIARYLAQALFPDDKKLSSAAYISGIWHDLGKLDPTFQTWLRTQIKKRTHPKVTPEDGIHIDSGKFSFDRHPRHNELSLILFSLMFDRKGSNLNRTILDFCQHTILWHHAKPLRKNDYNNQAQIYQQYTDNISSTAIQDLATQTKNIITLVNQLATDASLDEQIHLLSLDTEDIDIQLRVFLPEYKLYSEKQAQIEAYVKEILGNSKKNILRSAVISSDRIVSALSAEELEANIRNQSLKQCVANLLDPFDPTLTKHIERCLAKFDKPENAARNHQQKAAASKLSKLPNLGVLNGPAGCGKTKIALEWALQTNATKIIWICPRVQVCLGLYEDLSSNDYLPQARIELLTGEFQQIRHNRQDIELADSDRFSGDIVLTTVDQVINTITTHRQITALTSYINNHVIFDEFHELINIPGLNLLFAELVKAKQLRGSQAHTLLVSATPNQLFLHRVLDIHSDEIIGIPTFNKSPYKISFNTYEENDSPSPLVANSYRPDTFIITNSAKDAQRGFIAHQNGENAILLHGRFTKKDKLDLFERVYHAFKQNGNQEFDLLRAGPIIQASLNITCNTMESDITSAENSLQRLGRLNRFADRVQISFYTIHIPSSIAGRGLKSGTIARFLN